MVKKYNIENKFFDMLSENIQSYVEDENYYKKELKSIENQKELWKEFIVEIKGDIDNANMEDKYNHIKRIDDKLISYFNEKYIDDIEAYDFMLEKGCCIKDEKTFSMSKNLINLILLQLSNSVKIEQFLSSKEFFNISFFANDCFHKYFNQIDLFIPYFYIIHNSLEERNFKSVLERRENNFLKEIENNLLYVKNRQSYLETILAKIERSKYILVENKKKYIFNKQELSVYKFYKDRAVIESDAIEGNVINLLVELKWEMNGDYSEHFPESNLTNDELLSLEGEVFKILEKNYGLYLTSLIKIETFILENIDISKTQLKKIKLKGSPSILAYLMTELYLKGYIEPKLRNGDISYEGTAKMLWENFEIDTTLGNWIKEMNPGKCTLSDTKRQKFQLPYLSDTE